MAIPNRTACIERLYKVLRKHYKPVAPAVERDLLRQMMFACILEYANFDKAEAAMARILESAYDLNEIRVTTVSELAEAMVGCLNPKVAAWNLKRLLHSVYEQQYHFDLEHLRKQNLGKTQADLSRHPGATPFVVSYVTQHGLGGHSIPLNKGAFDVLYIAGAVDETERDNLLAPGLERAISKKQGIEFASLLHQLAVEIMASPFSPRVRGILSEMGPTAKDRLPKRPTTKKKPEIASQANGESSKRPATPAAESKSKKPAAAKKSPPPPKKPVKPLVTKQKTTKSLQRRKPR